MARRVNTKFLTILTVSVVGILLVGLVAHRFMTKESPEGYIARGTQLMQEKKYEEAVKQLEKAAALDQKNPSLLVAYGDALNQLSPNDVEYMRKAREAWDRALQVDPKTLYRWRQLDAFARAVQHRHDELRSGLSQRLSTLIDPALEIMAEHMKNPYDRARFRAAHAVLRLVKRRQTIETE